MSKTPIAMFGFNRPLTTVQVFIRVRAVRPEKLFLCLDGPREGRPVDIEKCNAVKKIFDGVDWPCEVKRNYAEQNMGCRRRMASGISWVFENVEEAILLEDDCVPHLDFFPFCEELLERYRFDTRIGMIAGHIAHLRPITKETSYYFDRFPTIWGWATWRRAWQCYDADMQEWPRLRNDPFLYSIFRTRPTVERIANFFEQMYTGKEDSWATVWWFSTIRQSFLCAHPSSNLVTNVGVHGAHNKGRSNWHGIPSSGMEFPLTHPRDVIPDCEEERRMVEVYSEKGLAHRVIEKARKILSRD